MADIKERQSIASTQEELSTNTSVNIHDTASTVNDIPDAGGVLKTVNDTNSLQKLALKTAISSIYSYGDIRTTYAGNWTYGGYQL